MNTEPRAPARLLRALEGASAHPPAARADAGPARGDRDYGCDLTLGALVGPSRCAVLEDVPSVLPTPGVTAALPVPDEDFRPPVNAECPGRHSLCGSDAASGPSREHSTTCLIREPLAALSASCISAVPPARYPRREACVVYVYILSVVVRGGGGGRAGTAKEKQPQRKWWPRRRRRGGAHGKALWPVEGLMGRRPSADGRAPRGPMGRHSRRRRG